MTLHAQLGPTLIGAALDHHHRVRVRVNGTSMRPLLQPGDYVWIERVAFATVQPGDVLTLWHAGGLLTHRVLKINAKGCVTKGDTCGSVDDPITADAIVGRVVAVECHGRYIMLDRRRWQDVGTYVAVLSLLHAAWGQHRWRWIRGSSVVVHAAIVGLLHIMRRMEEVWV